MIVVDASVIVDFASAIGRSTRLHRRIHDEHLIAPDFLPTEVASGLRGMNLGGKLNDNDLDTSVQLLERLRIGLHPSLLLVPRAMALRHNFSAYDASYVALAERLGCPLLTYDAKLAKAVEKHCAVELLPAG